MKCYENFCWNIFRNSFCLSNELIFEADERHSDWPFCKYISHYLMSSADLSAELFHLKTI